MAVEMTRGEILIIPTHIFFSPPSNCLKVDAISSGGVFSPPHLPCLGSLGQKGQSEREDSMGGVPPMDNAITHNSSDQWERRRAAYYGTWARPLIWRRYETEEKRARMWASDGS